MLNTFQMGLEWILFQKFTLQQKGHLYKTGWSGIFGGVVLFVGLFLRSKGTARNKSKSEVFLIGISQLRSSAPSSG